MGVTLSYSSSTFTFTADVDTPSGSTVSEVMLTGPSGQGPYPMMQQGGGNPSTWTQMIMNPASGTWTATATYMTTTTSSGSTTV